MNDHCSKTFWLLARNWPSSSSPFSTHSCEQPGVLPVAVMETVVQGHPCCEGPSIFLFHARLQVSARQELSGSDSKKEWKGSVEEQLGTFGRASFLLVI